MVNCVCAGVGVVKRCKSLIIHRTLSSIVGILFVTLGTSDLDQKKPHINMANLIPRRSLIFLLVLGYNSIGYRVISYAITLFMVLKHCVSPSKINSTTLFMSKVNNNNS